MFDIHVTYIGTFTFYKCALKYDRMTLTGAVIEY